MKGLHIWIPIFIIFAITALGLKLSQTFSPSCFACSTQSPYLTMMGSAYFITILLLFIFYPKFPPPQLTKFGLLGACCIALILTYLRASNPCPHCLIAHACNIVIWTLWLIASNIKDLSTLKHRLSSSLLSTCGAFALVTSLHFIFPSSLFKQKDIASIFPAQSTAEIHIINFVSPNCAYCKEQLSLLDNAAMQLRHLPYRFTNVTVSSIEELSPLASHTQWVEDQEMKLHQLFHVTGYPTMYIVDRDGKVTHVFRGASDEIGSFLLNIMK